MSHYCIFSNLFVKWWVIATCWRYGSKVKKGTVLQEVLEKFLWPFLYFYRHFNQSKWTTATALHQGASSKLLLLPFRAGQWRDFWYFQDIFSVKQQYACCNMWLQENKLKLLCADFFIENMYFFYSTSDKCDSTGYTTALSEDPSESPVLIFGIVYCFISRTSRLDTPFRYLGCIYQCK